MPETSLFLLYVGCMFYGLGRLAAWFLYARGRDDAPLDLVWGGPGWIEGNDLSDAGWVEVLWRTSLGGALFAVFLAVCWHLFLSRLWDRAEDPPAVARGRGLRAAFGGGH